MMLLKLGSYRMKFCFNIVIGLDHNMNFDREYYMRLKSNTFDRGVGETYPTLERNVPPVDLVFTTPIYWSLIYLVAGTNSFYLCPVIFFFCLLNSCSVRNYPSLFAIHKYCHLFSFKFILFGQKGVSKSWSFNCYLWFHFLIAHGHKYQSQDFLNNFLNWSLY